MPFFSIILLFPLSTFARLTTADRLNPFSPWADPCIETVRKFKNIHMQTGKFSNGICFIKIHPLIISDDLTYRDYIITSDNLLLIFNSFNKSTSKNSNGARDYYFFPNSQPMKYKHDPDSGLVFVQIGNGDQFKFSESKVELIGSSKGNVHVMSEIDPKFKGGVEFINYDGIIIDGGWSLGDRATANQNNLSQIRNKKEQVCKLQNKKYLSYSGDEYRLQSDKNILTAIRNNCPSFNFD